MTYGDYYKDGINYSEKYKKQWAEYHQQQEDFLEQTQTIKCPKCHGHMTVDFNKLETCCTKCGYMLNSTEYKQGYKYLHGGF